MCTDNTFQKCSQVLLNYFLLFCVLFLWKDTGHLEKWPITTKTWEKKHIPHAFHTNWEVLPYSVGKSMFHCVILTLADGLYVHALISGSLPSDTARQQALHQDPEPCAQGNSVPPAEPAQCRLPLGAMLSPGY